MKGHWLILHIAAAAMLATVVAAPMAHSVCCVCEGTEVDSCVTAALPSCEACASVCAFNSGPGTVRACCDNVANCGGGAAGECSTAACFQTVIGSGFCDGSCVSPIPNGLVGTEAPASSTTGLIVVVLLLTIIGAAASTRRAQRRSSTVSRV